MKKIKNQLKPNKIRYIIILPIILLDWGDWMIGLAADGRLFGLDAQLLFDAAITAICIFLLIIFVIIFIIFNKFVINFIKQVIDYFRVKKEYYQNHINDRQD